MPGKRGTEIMNELTEDQVEEYIDKHGLDHLLDKLAREAGEMLP